MQDLIENIALKYGEARVNFPGSNIVLSYKELLEKALLFAKGLQEEKLELTHPIGLVFNNTDEFLVAFFGCQLAGAIPSPFSPPASASVFNQHLQKIANVILGAGGQYLIVESKFEQMGRSFVEGNASPINIFTNQDFLTNASAGKSLTAGNRADGLVLVQYTSGSTAAPKGVCITRSNLMSAIDGIVSGINLTEDDVNGQWLPMHHDMGLIGMIAGFYKGVDHFIWTPSSFVRNPTKWLKAFAHYHATIYAGPNFSYEYLLNNIDEETLNELDLTHWRVAFNGAEPINPNVIERFINNFSKAGFRPSAMFPVYGLAEATLPVSFPKLGNEPQSIKVGRSHIASTGEVRIASDTEESTQKVQFVSVGSAIKGHKIRIVERGVEVTTKSRVGEIQVRGPAIMAGYYKQPAATDSCLKNGWLSTGDIGFVLNEHLYVVGRKKEMVIIHGQNFYPQDIEELIRNVEGIYRGNVISFSLERNDAEFVGIVMETKLRSPDEKEQLMQRARKIIREHLGLTAVEAHLVPPKTIYRTTSGKFMRVKMKQLIQEHGVIL